MTFTIKKANRKNAHIVLRLIGLANSGKTYSALAVARGLVGDKGRIGLVDSDNNRADLYAENFGGFDKVDIRPPFTPERFFEAANTFKGYDCIIVDSMSPEWDGLGGILEIAEDSGKKAQAKWKEPKARHHVFMAKLLQLSTHLILCYQGKIPMETDKNKKTETVAITEEKDKYAYTASIILENQIASLYKKGRCFEGLEYLFNQNKKLSIKTGQELLSWLNNKQRDVDTLIREGSQQTDIKAWASKLSTSERYLARKYYHVMKQKKEVTQQEPPTPTPESESELGNL